MTEYAHNHPPRCCCAFAPNRRADAPPVVCPLCPEHGELAQLGNDNPANNIPDGVVIADLAYACCHQLVGRPHTDYCPGPALPHDHRVYCSHIPTCPGYEVRTTADEFPPITDTNGNPLGTPVVEDPNVTGIVINQLHIAAPDVINRGAIIATHERHQCEPDRCGMWATQTTQPATQTSTPPSQTRASDLAYCGQRHPTAGHYCARPADPAHTEHWTHDQRGWSTADSEPTPHAKPTPGQAVHPDCGHPDWPDCPHHG